MSTVFTLLIVLCASISSLTPSLSKKLTNDRGPWYKKFTKTGLLTISSTLLTILFTILQFLYNENESSKKEKIAKAEQEHRDSLQQKMYESSLIQMKKSFDKSNIKIVTTLTTTLGKYGYKLDSASNSLVKVIKTSPNSKTVSINIPTLKLTSNNAVTKVDSSALRKTYRIALRSYDAGSTNFNVQIDMVSIYQNNKTQFSGSPNIFYPNERMFTNQIKYANISFFGPQVLDGFYIYIHGDYTDLTGKEKYIINDLYRYLIKNNELVLPNQETRYEIIKLITLSRK